MTDLAADPHAGQRVFLAGAAPQSAQAAMLLVHGRGASAADILSLTSEFGGQQPASQKLVYLAPQAAGFSWYPERFLVPVSKNEPWLSSALRSIDLAHQQAILAGIPTDRLILLGFSQGACLVLEYAARHAQRYGAVIGLSGGLIGADEEPRQDDGHLQGTPVFLGCSDDDAHIPEYRVHHAARILTELGGQVETRIYPAMGHTIHEDEIQAVQELVQKVLQRA